MASSQLDVVIADIQKTFGAWGPTTALEQMRKDWDGLFANTQFTVGAKSEKVDAGGVRAEWIVAPNAAADRAILYLHGGGYVLGSIHSHRDMCERLSRAAQARVLALDYRLAPENPYPAAVEDATAAYRWLIKQGFKPKKIAIGGDSAGGGLTFATLLKLKQDGDPMPACATPISPWVDLEANGESMTSRDEIDPMVHKPMILNMAQTYLGGKSAKDPLAAPIHGDLSGFPPLLIHVGQRETLYSDAARMYDKAKAAGVPVELDEVKGQIHVWHIFASRLDEGEESIRKLGAFIRKHTA